MNATVSKIGVCFFIAMTFGCGRLPEVSGLMDVAGLSPSFVKTCANCHGSQGEGDVGPALKSVDFASFSAKVRAGGKGMPKFDLATYSDESLKADFKSLTGKTAP